MAVAGSMERRREEAMKTERRGEGRGARKSRTKEGRAEIGITEEGRIEDQGTGGTGTGTEAAALALA